MFWLLDLIIEKFSGFVCHMGVYIPQFVGWVLNICMWTCSIVQIGNLRPEKDEETLASRVVSQRDMATQMSPKERRRRSSFSPSPPALLSLAEQQSDHSDQSEVKDVEVEKRATMVRWSKRRGIRFSKKGPPDDNDFNENAVEVRTSSFDITEAAMDISKYVLFYFCLDFRTFFSLSPFNF